MHEGYPLWYNMTHTMEIIFVLFLILLNGVLAMAEIAIVSSRKSKLQHRAAQGDVRAKKALELSANPNRFLSTVQIGITLVGVFAGAYGEATLSKKLAASLVHIPLLGVYNEPISFVIVVGAITYLSLVVGEIVPKRIGLAHPEFVATAAAIPMTMLSRATSPLVSLLSSSTEMILRALHISKGDGAIVSEDEIRLMIREGARTGVFEIAEKDIVERTFQLADKKVTTLMTPRKHVVWLNLRATSKQLVDKIAKHPHTQYPVCDGALDKVVGVVRAEGILMQAFTKKDVQMESLLIKPLFIPDSMGGLQALELFRRSGVHIAIIVDEYANIQGIVSLDDIVTAIMGDMPELGEQQNSQITKRSDSSWLVDGLAPIDEFKQHFHIDALPSEEGGEYETVGGFLMYLLGRVPGVTDTVLWEGFHFEILDMDGNRIDKVLVKKSV